jgi:hypothetical protein
VAGEIHVHIDTPEYEAARYAFQVLLATAEAPIVFHRTSPSSLTADAVLITYSYSRLEPAHRRHLVLCANRRLWDQYGQESSLPPSPLPRVPLEALGVRSSPRLRDPMVLPYASAATPEPVEIRSNRPGDSLVTGADVVASTFFWITRYQETLIRERDEVGRIPQSLLREVQEALTARPLVDEYSELLMAWLAKLGSTVTFRSPSFRVLLTHDVDTGIGVRRFWEHADNGLRTFYRDAVRGRRPRTGLWGLGHWMLRGLGLRSEASLFRDIVRLDAEFGFPSFFFLMANGTHPQDARYDILGDAARRVVRAIGESGSGMGLHVGLNAHETPGELFREWERLRRASPRARPVSRSHFLAFFPPATWRQLVELGIRADSSLGFSHHAGFRGGTCRAFRPFDVERREVLSLWELPMVLMDVHLFRGTAVPDTTRIAAVRDLADRVKAHGGCLVINWHNVSYFGHYRRVYRAILGNLRGGQAVSLDDLPTGEGAVIW